MHLPAFYAQVGHKGGLLKRTDVHHRLSYNHKFFTSVYACAVQSHRLHVSPSWLGCSTIYVHYHKNQGAWQTHVCHVAVCMGYPIAGEVPRASVEAPWTPASLVPGSIPAARAARSGSSAQVGGGLLIIHAALFARTDTLFSPTCWTPPFPPLLEQSTA